MDRAFNKKSIYVYLTFFTAFFLFSGCGITIRNIKTIPEAETIKTTFIMEVDIENAERTEILRYKVRIPVNINYRQKILEMRFDPEPKYIFDDGTERFVEYYFTHPEDNFKLKMEFDVELYRYDVNIAKNFDVDFSSEIKPSRFLRSEKKIESSDPEILKMANEITGKNRYEIVEKIYFKVVDTLDYDMSMGHRKSWKGAKESAIQGKGVCSDYADLFVALCRAKGIPARYVSGYVVSETSTNIGHAWTEVYFEDKGWIRFDPTWGDNILSDTDFFHNTPKYIEIMRSSRNSDTLFYYRGNPPKITQTVKSVNIVELNTIHQKVTSKTLSVLINEDPLFVQILTRNKNMYSKYVESLSIKEDIKERLTEITEIIFKTESLDQDDISELEDFIKVYRDRLSKAGKFYRQLYKRFIWMANYRLDLEKNILS